MDYLGTEDIGDGRRAYHVAALTETGRRRTDYYVETETLLPVLFVIRDSSGQIYERIGLQSMYVNRPDLQGEWTWQSMSGIPEAYAPPGPTPDSEAAPLATALAQHSQRLPQWRDSEPTSAGSSDSAPSAAPSLRAPVPLRADDGRQPPQATDPAQYVGDVPASVHDPVPVSLGQRFEWSSVPLGAATEIADTHVPQRPVLAPAKPDLRSNVGAESPPRAPTAEANSPAKHPVELSSGCVRTLRTQFPIADVLTNNPNTCQVEQSGDHTARLVGGTPGMAQVLVWARGRTKPMLLFEVNVSGSEAAVSATDNDEVAKLRGILAVRHPQHMVKLTERGNKLIVDAVVPSEAIAREILTTVEQHTLLAIIDQVVVADRSPRTQRR